MTHNAREQDQLDLDLGPGCRLMVLAPHPDDECLAAGGLLARAMAAGAEVRVVYVTAGDNAPWIQRVYERRLRIGREDRRRFGALRRQEAFAAAKELGLPSEALVFLEQPDQSITSELTSGRSTLIEALCQALEEFRPEIVIAPSSADLHPDHSALALLLQAALPHLVGIVPRPRLLHYVIHARGNRAQDRPRHVAIHLSDRERACKRRALLSYGTQMSVHRKKFLAFAQAQECFFLDEPGPRWSPDHPLRRTSTRAGNLCFELEPRATLGAYGPQTLFLALETEHGTFETFSIRLGAWRAEHTVELVEFRQRTAEARVKEHKGSKEVLLSLGLFAHARRLFVKLERRFGFFDEAGWIEVALPEGVRAAAPIEAPLKPRKARVVCAVVPCYNIASLCEPVVRETMTYAEHVLAVDDGSSDGTADVLQRIADESGGRVRLIRFERNRGKGVALLEAFSTALAETPFDVLVTLDGDGQHRPRDIPRLVSACRGETDVVIGERLDLTEMPLRSRIGYLATSWLMKLCSSDAPTDTQSGMRAFDRRFVTEIVRTIQGQRYETELRILMLALAQRRRIASVPIPSLYFNGNKSSHFRVLVDSARIYATLFSEGVPVMIAGHRRRRS